MPMNVPKTCQWRGCENGVVMPSERGKLTVGHLCEFHVRKLYRLAHSDAALDLSVGKAIEEVRHG